MANDRPISLSRLQEALLACLDSETNSSQSDQERVDRLAIVVERHRGQSLDAENIASELVEAILGWIFGAKSETATFSRDLVLSVTRSIVDDPAAHQRLNRLWTMLCEEYE